jgi:hypothetical protein
LIALVALCGSENFAKIALLSTKAANPAGIAAKPLQFTPAMTRDAVIKFRFAGSGGGVVH